MATWWRYVRTAGVSACAQREQRLPWSCFGSWTRCARKHSSTACQTLTPVTRTNPNPNPNPRCIRSVPRLRAARVLRPLTSNPIPNPTRTRTQGAPESVPRLRAARVLRSAPEGRRQAQAAPEAWRIVGRQRLRAGGAQPGQQVSLPNGLTRTL